MTHRFRIPITTITLFGASILLTVTVGIVLYLGFNQAANSTRQLWADQAGSLINAMEQSLEFQLKPIRYQAQWIAKDIHDLSNLALFDETLPAYQDWDYLVRLVRHWQVDTVADPLLRQYREPGVHVWHPQNTLKARTLLLQKYADELASRPQALGIHHLRIALVHGALDNRREFRSHLWKAVQANPRALGIWAKWLLGSIVGSASYTRLSRFRAGGSRA